MFATCFDPARSSSGLFLFLPDDDPVGSKHLANVHNKTNDNTVIFVYLLRICCIDDCTITICKILPLYSESLSKPRQAIRQEASGKESSTWH
jgi:hypothetical protein